MNLIEQFRFLIGTFNWHTPSWDLFIFLFWVVASVIYGFAAGRGRILSILISVYMSKLLVIEAPFLSQEIAKKLPSTATSLQQLITFGLLFLILFVFLSRFAFKTSVDGRHLKAIPFSLVFAFLQIGLLINIVLNFLPIITRNHLSPLVQFVFLQPWAGFVWLVLPVIFLIATGKYISEHVEM